MSSVNYRDKCLEEIRPLVEQYCENYRKTFGKEPDMEKLKQKLENLKKKKEDEVFTGIFGQLNSKNIADCAQIIDEKGKKKSFLNKIKG